MLILDNNLDRALFFGGFMKLIVISFISAIFLSACQQSLEQTLNHHNIPSTEENRLKENDGTKEIAIEFSHHNEQTLVAYQTGEIKGYEVIDYTLFLKQGQYLNMSLATQNLSTYFNIYAPNSDEALFNGSSEGEQYEGIVEQTGQYRIRIYQMRASARRNKLAKFGLEIIINKL